MIGAPVTFAAVGDLIAILVSLDGVCGALHGSSHCLTKNVTEQFPAHDWGCVIESRRWRRWRGKIRVGYSTSSCRRRVGIASTRCGRCVRVEQGLGMRR